MNNSDSASLANLNDIVLVPPPDWWPPAPGWYALAVVSMGVVIWLSYRYYLRYQHNRYRRAALAELANIEAEGGLSSARLLPALLKRTALHVWPRNRVAALSGDKWREFLDQHCEFEPFKGPAGDLLTKLAYYPHQISNTDLPPLIKSIRTWIQHHRVDPC